MGKSECAGGAASAKREKSVLEAVGSVLLAIVASSHHWVHTILIALGLTTIGSGLLSLPGPFKILFLLVSLAISVRFIFVARQKWRQDRAVAWVYLISSVISIVLVATAVPQTAGELFNQSAQPIIEGHQQHHSQ
ncbi:hypothetical protein [Anaeroselena agilis]|uniref:Uncharacterized protein n=1 Tax=Anaeroselena agilis TaxID=3063788 RepID=A0ABU3NS53_9FIRM|nr:hypothetical protein [Selenomonadales bacterium 4137-cl]